MFNRRKTGELVVKPRLSPHVKLLLVTAIVTSILLGAGWMYRYGSAMAGFDRFSADQQQQQLQDAIQRKETENQELRDSLARTQRSLQMNETAFQELDHSLKASAQEIVKLREELNFYRNIISPADKKSGLRIQNLFIESAGSGTQYRYKLVLIQALKHEQTIRGSAKFEIAGMQDGQEKVLTFPTTNERPVAVNFKYFQDIEGRFDLPSSFKPRQVKVNVVPANGQTVEQTYAWPQASNS